MKLKKMLPIKLSNLNSNFLTFLFVILFFCSSSFGEEKSVDIWGKKNETKSEENKKELLNYFTSDSFINRDAPMSYPQSDVQELIKNGLLTPRLYLDIYKECFLTNFGLPRAPDLNHQLEIACNNLNG